MNKNVHTYIGSTEGIIDWDQVIAYIRQATHGDDNSIMLLDEPLPEFERADRPFTFFSESDGVEDMDELAGSLYDLIDIWTKANYRLEDIQWIDYYPGTHFPMDVQDRFAEIVDAVPLRVFVSVIEPGTTVPYHWDIEDHEIEWKDLNLVRYVCFMHDPVPGQLFAIDEYCFNMPEKHSIWQWKHRKNWHAAANCGFETNYMFHFLGYKK